MQLELTPEETRLVLAALETARLVADMNVRDPHMAQDKPRHLKTSDDLRALYRKLSRSGLRSAA